MKAIHQKAVVKPRFWKDELVCFQCNSTPHHSKQTYSRSSSSCGMPHSKRDSELSTSGCRYASRTCGLGKSDEINSLEDRFRYHRWQALALLVPQRAPMAASNSQSSKYDSQQPASNLQIFVGTRSLSEVLACRS